MPPTDSNPKSIIRRLIPGLLFGFLVFLTLILIGDIQQIGDIVLAFPWKLYPLVIALTLFNYLLRFFKWHYYLGVIGVKNFSLLRSAHLFIAGFPLAMTPGKVGEALKAVWLERETGIPTARGISVVLAERISDGLGVLVLSTLGVIAYPRYWPAFAAILGILLTLIIISQIRPLAHKLLIWGESLPLVGRFANPLREFYEGSYILFRPRTTFTAVSLGTISWLGEGVGLYVILLGLGVPAGWETLSIAVFVLAFSTVIGAASALPGGLGASEASIAGMLALLLTLNGETASAATLLIRFATLWFGVGLGLTVWAVSPQMAGLKDEG